MIVDNVEIQKALMNRPYEYRLIGIGPHIHDMLENHGNINAAVTFLKNCERYMDAECDWMIQWQACWFKPWIGSMNPYVTVFSNDPVNVMKAMCLYATAEKNPDMDIKLGTSCKLSEWKCLWNSTLCDKYGVTKGKLLGDKYDGDVLLIDIYAEDPDIYKKNYNDLIPWLGFILTALTDDDYVHNDDIVKAVSNVIDILRMKWPKFCWSRTMIEAGVVFFWKYDVKKLEIIGTN